MYYRFTYNQLDSICYKLKQVANSLATSYQVISELQPKLEVNSGKYHMATVERLRILANTCLKLSEDIGQVQSTIEEALRIIDESNAVDSNQLIFSFDSEIFDSKYLQLVGLISSESNLIYSLLTDSYYYSQWTSQANLNLLSEDIILGTKNYQLFKYNTKIVEATKLIVSDYNPVLLERIESIGNKLKHLGLIDNLVSIFNIFDDAQTSVSQNSTDVSGHELKNLGMIDQLDIDKLLELYPGQAGYIQQVAELRKTKQLDNAYVNIRMEVNKMGITQFTADPKRLEWLLANPQIQASQFTSNLLPDQLRIVTEELPYVLFSEQPDGQIIFDTEFYNSLINHQTGQMDMLNRTSTDRFIDEQLNFEPIYKPGTNQPWYVIQDGFEAAAIRVNGEVLVLFPGSQELKADWIETDIAPNIEHRIPNQYLQGVEVAKRVKAEYPDDNIILCGHSLAGGTVSYAGSETDINSFYIDPAPAAVENQDYRKGISIIPGGKRDGILNKVKRGNHGYDTSETDIDIVNGIAAVDQFNHIVGGKNGKSLVNRLATRGQSNDHTPRGETAYRNKYNERTDADDQINPGVQDKYTGYGGDHLAGYIDSDFKYSYLPYERS